MLYIIAAYFVILFVVSRMASRRNTDSAFFRGDRQSPWYMVAFGMVGASISGVSFVSVPGMVLQSGYAYLEVCAGFIVGYFAVAYVLLPLYYKYDLTTIYTYLRRISDQAYLTGSLFFVISKLLGAAAKFYVPCLIISRVCDVDFTVTVVAMLMLVWLYTRRSGIKALVWTDVLQTSCMFITLGLIIYKVSAEIPSSGVMDDVTASMTAALSDTGRCVLNFVSGAFIVIVMTGLDQDMMQKNLTCRTLRDAQKDMCCYGLAFLPVNALFLILGTMLVGIYQSHGMALPEKPDELLTTYCIDNGGILLSLFTLGIVATSFSTVDSALTALTTTVCVDLLKGEGRKVKRPVVHLVMAAIMAVCCMLFDCFNTISLIDAIYMLVGYTYGPLLGLFAYAMTMHGKQNTPAKKGGELVVCLLSPLLCYVLSVYIEKWTGYHFGYELLLINGLLTYIGLYMSKKIVFLRQNSFFM